MLLRVACKCPCAGSLGLLKDGMLESGELMSERSDKVLEKGDLVGMFLYEE